MEAKKEKIEPKRTAGLKNPSIRKVTFSESDRFVLYVSNWKFVGLSNHMISFQRAAEFAVRHGRTLVVVPPIDGHVDYDYAFDGMWSFTDFANRHFYVHLDADRIKKLGNDFTRKQSYVEALFDIAWTRGHTDESKELKWIPYDEALTHPSFPKRHRCWLYYFFQVREQIERQHASEMDDKYLCIGFSFSLSPKKTKELHLLEEPISLANLDTPILVPSKSVKQITMEWMINKGLAKQNKFGNAVEPFLGLHLRKGDWKEFCQENRLTVTRCFADDLQIDDNIDQAKELFIFEKIFLSTNDKTDEERFRQRGAVVMDMEEIEEMSSFKDYMADLSPAAVNYVKALFPILASQFILSLSRPFLGNYYSSYSMYVRWTRPDDCSACFIIDSQIQHIDS